MWHVKSDKWHVTLHSWHVTGERRKPSLNMSALYLLQFLEFQVSCDNWHVTQDTWHLTRYRRHVTCNTQHMTYTTQGMVNNASKFQVPSSNGLGVMMFWRLGGKGSNNEWMHEWMNEWMNDKGFSRTAPATRGLVDNRPSPALLHQYVKKSMALHMWHVTQDTWHKTCDMWHVTCEIWHVVGGDHSLKISAP